MPNTRAFIIKIFTGIILYDPNFHGISAAAEIAVTTAATAVTTTATAATIAVSSDAIAAAPAAIAATTGTATSMLQHPECSAALSE